jgi:hypothetical protein
MTTVRDLAEQTEEHEGAMSGPDEGFSGYTP